LPDRFRLREETLSAAPADIGTAFSGGQILSEDGAGLGSGIFLQGNQTLTFAPGARVVLTISDSIFDQNGYDGGTRQHGAPGFSRSRNARARRAQRLWRA